jgi:class 3 adenylate cyclase
LFIGFQISMAVVLAVFFRTRREGVLLYGPRLLILVLQRITTIGDGYLAVAGVPLPFADHADAVAELALATQTSTREVASALGRDLQVRIGRLPARAT